MVSLDGILENLIAEGIFVFISAVASYFFPKLVKKQNVIETKNRFDPLKVAIFLTLMSGLNLILSIIFWEDGRLTSFLAILSLVLVFLTVDVLRN